MTKNFIVTLPDIGEGVVEGEVIEWLKRVDDPVALDEPVVVVMTDKATVELPSPYAGILVKQYYQPGQMAIKDKPLYEIASSDVHDNSLPPKEAGTLRAQAKKEERQEFQQVKKEAALCEACSEVTPAAPPVRLFARQMGVNLDEVKGTGIEGLVTHEDLIKHVSLAKEASSHPLQAPIAHLEGDQEVPLIGVRHLMAKKMALAHAEIPHFSYFEQLDATRLVQLRYRFKEEAAKQGIAVTYMPFIIRALSLTLRQYPIANSSLDLHRQVVILHQEHNIGIATTTKQGLIVPVLKHVDQMHLQEIILAYEQLKQKALGGKLHPDEMKGGTVTITNFGVLGGGGMWATPIINYPETAILGLSRIQKQPVVKNDELVIRDLLNLSWSFDHRVIDGDQAATISHYLSNLLQNPAALL